MYSLLRKLIYQFTLDGKLLIKKADVQNIELVTSNWSKGIYIMKVKGSAAYQNAIITKL